MPKRDASEPFDDAYFFAVDRTADDLSEFEVVFSYCDKEKDRFWRNAIQQGNQNVFLESIAQDCMDFVNGYLKDKKYSEV